MKIGGIHENSLQVKQKNITPDSLLDNFSNYLTILHIETKKKTVTVSVFRYLILISIDFYNFISPFSP